MSVGTCWARLDAFDSVGDGPHLCGGHQTCPKCRAGAEMYEHAPKDLRLLLKVLDESLKTVEVLSRNLAELAQKHHETVGVAEPIQGYMDAVKAFQDAS